MLHDMLQRHAPLHGNRERGNRRLTVKSGDQACTLSRDAVDGIKAVLSQQPDSFVHFYVFK
jgi:hypothetical protein